MKKIYMIILVLCIICINTVSASSLSFNFVKIDGEYKVEVSYDGEKIPYEEAIEKHDLDEYLEMYYDGANRYFYMGNEVSYDEYNREKSAIDADKIVSENKNYIRVHNTEEFIDALKKIYQGTKLGQYKLVYSEPEYNSFDLSEIENYYDQNILTNINKNTFKFEEYGLVHPIRFMPTIGKTETVVLYTELMITKAEMEQVEEFTDYFIPLFKNKTDYEKILGVYNYIRDNTTYEEDNGYDFYTDALLSPYDIIFKKKMVCIGAATTFQYFMEKLGVESYIVDKVEEIDVEKKIYATSHTYNIVRLDDKWYIIDLSVDGKAFLTANDEEYNIDTNSLNLEFAKKDYPVDSKIKVKLDYDKIDAKIKEISGEEQPTSKFYYIIIPIVIVVVIVGFIFIKKKNK